MGNNIRGKVAMIGGASQGLGYACAKRLAMEGCKLAICSRDQDKISKASQKLAEITEVIPVAADLSTREGTDRFAEISLDTYKQVDILVHNTGGPPAGYFAEFDDNDWQNAFDLLLMSAVRLYRYLLPGMIERKWGKIVNITSIAVKEPVHNLILSNSIRVGVAALAKTLAVEHAANGININNVAPGLFKTDRLVAIAENMGVSQSRNPAEILAEMADSVPLKRLGEPMELAEVVTYLCKPESVLINGATISVDGGKISSLF